jgi:hypothetical protein
MLWVIALLGLYKESNGTLDELGVRLDHIEKKLNDLRILKEQLSLLIPESPFQTESQSFEALEEKPLVLFSIDTSRTAELQSLMAPLDFLRATPILPNSFPPAIFAPRGAPLFLFRPTKLAVAKRIVLDPCQVESFCSVKTVRFEFYYENQLIFRSRVINLALTYDDEIEIELDTEIIFDCVIVNVIRNWGNDFETCLGSFHVKGPIVS